VGDSRNSARTGKYPVRRQQSGPLNELGAAAGGENLCLGPQIGRSSMLSQYQRHEEDNLEAAERREQRLMKLLRQSNDM